MIEQIRQHCQNILDHIEKYPNKPSDECTYSESRKEGENDGASGVCEEILNIIKEDKNKYTVVYSRWSGDNKYVYSEFVVKKDEETLRQCLDRYDINMMETEKIFHGHLTEVLL